MDLSALDARIAAIRHFNRFYTRQIRLLEGDPESPRALTDEGRAEPDPPDRPSRDAVAAMLERLDAGSQDRLVSAMQVIERILGVNNGSQAPFLLRSPRPGDMGWVVQRHGELYAREYGWDATFESLVARIVADFVDHLDPAREQCWIAEHDGTNVGCVFLVKHPEREGVAKLRLLLVDPAARGLGIGGRLVEECIRAARQRGYHTLTLWTNDVLVSARRIYESAGFRLVHEASHTSFGHDLVEQTWELDL